MWFNLPHSPPAASMYKMAQARVLSWFSTSSFSLPSFSSFFFLFPPLLSLLLLLFLSGAVWECHLEISKEPTPLSQPLSPHPVIFWKQVNKHWKYGQGWINNHVKNPPPVSQLGNSEPMKNGRTKMGLTESWSCISQGLAVGKQNPGMPVAGRANCGDSEGDEWCSSLQILT